MERYDIAIIGTGPGGVSAAITAKIRNKTVLLLGSADLTQKLQKAHRIQNYPGLPDIAGAALAGKLRDHLAQLDIPITEARVNAVYAMGDHFALQAGEAFYEARTVILATGVTAAKPLPGEEALLGRGVSYCATCDAALYRGKNVAVLGYSPREEAEAAFLSEIAGVTYFPVYAGAVGLPDAVRVLREKPTAIEAEGAARVVVTEQGRHAFDGVFVLREAIAPGQLVPGLAADGAHVRTDRSCATSLPGCFACGDITGTPYQYIKAAGEGNVAALSAVQYLSDHKET